MALTVGGTASQVRDSKKSSGPAERAGDLVSVYILHLCHYHLPSLLGGLAKSLRNLLFHEGSSYSYLVEGVRIFELVIPDGTLDKHGTCFFILFLSGLFGL